MSQELPPGFTLDAPPPKRKSSNRTDGDTFSAGGRRKRLSGVDAFEADQTGVLLDGTPVPLGEQATAALLPFIGPGAVVTPHGRAAWGRDAVTVSMDGRDAGEALVGQGLALPVPNYLTPEMRDRYLPVQRDAIAAERGAYGGQYQTPESYRRDGIAAPMAGKILMTPDQAAAWEQLVRDPTTTPDQVGAWLVSQGHDAENVRNVVRFLSRNPQAEANPAFQQQDAEGNPVQPEPRGLILRSLDALNEGIIDIVAAPLDLSHAIATPIGEALGVDMSAGSPFAAGIRDAWHGIGLGQRDEGSAPRSDLERYGQAFLRGTGSALIPVGGTLGVGSKLATRTPSLATQASAVRSAFRDSLVDAARSPGTAVALEAGAGAGSYLGEEVANDLAPGNPYAALAGQMIGGLGGGFAGGGAARRLGARSSGDTVVPARVPDAPEAAMFDDAAPMVERDGALFAKLADGREVPIPVDPSGKPGVTWTENGWEALLEVGPDGAGQYGPQNIPNALPSPYRDLANRLNAATPRPMGAPDAAQPVPGNAGNAPEALPPDGATPDASSDPEFQRAMLEGLQRGSVRTVEDANALAAQHGVQIGDQAALAEAFGSPSRAMPMEGGPGRSELAAPRQPDRIDLSARPRPLLDPATDAERMAAAERLGPNDILPVPASRVADVDEAAAIDRGRYQREAAGNPRAALETRGYRDPKNGLKVIRRKGPPDLVTWLRSEGGLALSDQDVGEFRQAGIDNTPRNDLEFAKGEDKLGNLLDDERGMPLDYAAMRAWEAGYFPELPERPTVQEFMDALVATHRGGSGRVFHPDDLPELDRYRAADAQYQGVKAAQQDGVTLMRDRSEPVSLDDLEANAAPVEAYIEWGENAPDFAGNIRLAGLDSPQEIKRALTQVERSTGGFDAARRGRISQAETERLAGELGMTPKSLLSRRKGQAFNAEEALAARQILAKSGNELVNMAKRLKSKVAEGEASDADLAAFRQAIVRHAAIQEQIAGATAEAGRTLAQFKITADARNVRGDVLRSLIDNSGGVEGLEDAANAIIENAGDPKRLNPAVAAMARPSLKDKAVEIWYNYLLSGPRTHAVNITSNLLTQLAQIPEHAGAAIIGAPRALRDQKADRVLFSELGARTAGMMQGAAEGLRQFGRTMRTGEPSDAASKVEAQTMKAISGVKGSILRTPTRLLMAEDEFFKASARRMEVVGQAVRQAAAEGLRGPAAKARAAELAANPTPEMLEKAADYGRYLTFQRKLGPAGQAIINTTSKFPVLKLFVPFVRTPINLLKFAIERSPAAPALKEWRDDFKAGGARRDLALAKSALGTGTLMLTLKAAEQGLITGGGPADESAKRLLEADGWQPYSVKVGDQYYSYQRLDPFSTTLGMAADYVDLQSHMTEKQREETASLLAASTLANLSEKTWLSGMRNFAEAMSDPGRYGQNALAKIAASAAVPTLLSQTTQAVDPVQRDARSVLDRIRSRLPGASSSLPVRRDVMGEQIEGSNGGGLASFSPILVKERRNDPVIRELLGAGVTIDAPSRRVGGEELTPQQYSEYQAFAGAIMRPRLAELVGSPEWASMLPSDRKDAAETVVRDARKEARETLFSGEAVPTEDVGEVTPYARGRALSKEETARYRATAQRLAGQMMAQERKSAQWAKMSDAEKRATYERVVRSARAVARDSVVSTQSELPQGFRVDP